MVSDEELVERLRQIVRESDLETATAGSVRRQLESVLGENLTDRKVFIRAQIDEFLEILQVEENAKHDNEVKEEENKAETNSEEIADAENQECEEEEEEEEEDTTQKENSKKRKGKKVSKPRGGFGKVCSLSPQLQVIVGASELARTEVVKRIWAYIRQNNLQDPNKRNIIICDDGLQALFRVKTIHMFKMNKILFKHIWPLAADNECGQPGNNSASSFEEEAISDKEEEEINRNGIEKKQTKNKGQSKKRRNKEISKDDKKPNGFTKLCKLSLPLQEFVGARVMSRTEVVKKVWSYIHEKSLQDPTNRRIILCDDSLRSLFDVESINMFQMNKVLSQHISPLDEEAAPEKLSLSDTQ